MSKREAYLFYEAGQAVAAAHLGLNIRHVCTNPALGATNIVVPRDDPKLRITLWLTGMAAEKKGAGRSDPLRRTRNRARIRALLESPGASRTNKPPSTRNLRNQAQDRANAICTDLFDAIVEVVDRLRTTDLLDGGEIHAIVRAVKLRRSKLARQSLPEPPSI